MANVYDTEGTFTVERLRGRDAAYLRGATRPVVGAAAVAIATGPQVLGPSGAVGANEWYGINVTMPAVPDLVWVMVSSDYMLRYKNGVSAPQTSYLYAIGNLGNTDAYEPPVLGLGANLSTSSLGSTGLYVGTVNPTAQPRSPSMWHPLDPSLTREGWYVVVTHQAAAAGLLADDLATDMASVRLLGYPTNLWGTGELWEPMKSRGS